MSLYDDIVDVQVTQLNYSVPAAVPAPVPTPLATSTSASNAPTLPVVKPGLMPPQLMARKFALPVKKPVAPKAPIPVPALFSPAAEQQVEKAVVTSPAPVSVKPAAIEAPAVPPPPPAEPKQPIDEYDPVKPNDYELINLERKRIHETERKAKEAESARLMEEMQRADRTRGLASKLFGPTTASSSTTVSDVATHRTEGESETKRRKVAGPTRVVLLLNMVGRGQVDPELEAETADECSRFGAVKECVIFELLDATVPDSEAVRIFVHFETVAAAMAAVAELGGRYFDGRSVKASYWDESKFQRRELM